ncbi:hypothetical protein [Sphingomonas jinjuensis]|nr:hypothetical protein [Sphingomonas jinjuensis]
MVDYPKIETPFRRAARRLVTPAARRFEPDSWSDALASCADAGDDDHALLAAALWTAREMRALEASLPEPFPGMSSTQAVMLGVAASNLEQLKAQQAVRDRQRSLETDDMVSFDYFSHLPYANVDGQELSQSDFGEAGIEALVSWLFDARSLEAPDARDVPGDQVIGVVGSALRYYSLRAVLKNQFDKALHLGARLETGEVDAWQPRDPALARLQHAWQARAETDVITAALEVRDEWPRLTPMERRARLPRRSVIAARATPRGSRLVVGRRECLSNRPPFAAIARRTLERSYLACFLDQDMPLAPGLTASLLADAWWVIGDAGRQLLKLPKKMPGFRTSSGWAAAVRRHELVGTLARVLGVREETADAIIAFLTFHVASGDAFGPVDPGARPGRSPRKGDRGLWAFPLVAVPQEEVLFIPITVFEIGAMLYRVEAWLERGGIDDDALEHRGDVFEADLRRRCAEVVRGNPAFRTARVAEREVERSTVFPHQVDLLFRLGDRVFVGEVKCFLTPADPHQWDRFYRQKLPDAARQARMRAEELGWRPDVVAEALGIDEAEAASMGVHPLVVLNIGAGFSLRVDGCRVVHSDFLLSYLRGPVMEAGAAVKAGKRVVTRVERLYENEREASDRFDAAMADPWPLRRFLDRLGWEETQYPKPSGGRFTIGSPARGNLTREEAGGYQAILAELGVGGSAD